MHRLFLLVALALAGVAARGADLPPPTIEQQVSDAVKAPGVTVVHLWAPWCSNCKAELSEKGWANFLAMNPGVNVIFVTVWSGEQGDGKAMLEKYGVGGQENFKLLLHPNLSRKKADKMTEFLGLPLSWIPTTWVFREGTLRYALNYGELRFPMLQQLVRDAADAWDR